jgi:iron-sulfur cluster assembly protein
MPVIVTEAAAREIDTIVSQQGLDPAKIHLRVGVKGGGCSGFSYLLDLTEVCKETDEVWTYSFERKGAAVAVAAGGGAGEPEPAGTYSVKVICDPKSYLYLDGTVVDFKDEIMGRGFVFSNPNATSSCGCGSSFSA